MFCVILRNIVKKSGERFCDLLYVCFGVMVMMVLVLIWLWRFVGLCVVVFMVILFWRSSFLLKLWVVSMILLIVFKDGKERWRRSCGKKCLRWLMVILVWRIVSVLFVVVWLLCCCLMLVGMKLFERFMVLL